MTSSSNFIIRKATENDAATILALIKELAEYEKLSHEVEATEADIRRSLFGDRPVAEALIGELEGVPISFALFFYNFSTFLGKPGIYYTSNRNTAATVSAAKYSPISPGWQKKTTAADSSGRF